MNILKNTELTSDAKIVLLIMQNEGLPSVMALGRELGWGHPKMGSALTELVEKGFVTKERKPEKVKGFQYNYVLTTKANVTN